LNAANLVGEFSEEPFVDIDYFLLDFVDLTDASPTVEFAIDNFRVNFGGGSAEDSNVRPEHASIGTNRLRGSFDATISFNAENDGTGDTTFTATLEPTSASQFSVFMPVTNEPIAAGQKVSAGPVAILSKDELSGLYESFTRIHNDLKATDPDEILPYRVTIYDPPDLSDDTGSTVQVDVDAEIFIANAAAGPHAGAERAGVKVTARTTSGSGFSVTGLEVDEFVHPGESDTATVGFASKGQVSGVHNGTFSVDLEMNSSPTGFLNGDEPVPSRTWNLSLSVPETNSDDVAFGLGQTVVRVHLHLAVRRISQ